MAIPQVSPQDVDDHRREEEVDHLHANAEDRRRQDEAKQEPSRPGQPTDPRAAHPDRVPQQPQGRCADDAVQHRQDRWTPRAGTESPGHDDVAQPVLAHPGPALSGNAPRIRAGNPRPGEELAAGPDVPERVGVGHRQRGGGDHGNRPEPGDHDGGRAEEPCAHGTIRGFAHPADPTERRRSARGTFGASRHHHAARTLAQACRPNAPPRSCRRSSWAPWRPPSSWAWRSPRGSRTPTSSGTSRPAG